MLKAVHVVPYLLLISDEKPGKPVPAIYVFANLKVFRQREVEQLKAIPKGHYVGDIANFPLHEIIDCIYVLIPGTQTSV